MLLAPSTEVYCWVLKYIVGVCGVLYQVDTPVVFSKWELLIDLQIQ